jgi:hypothetical protein
MPQRERPPPGGEGDPPISSRLPGIDSPDTSRAECAAQAEIVAFPRAERARLHHDGAVLQFRPRHRPPTTPRTEVRVIAVGFSPYGGITRSFELTERGLAQLLETAERLEALA